VTRQSPSTEFISLRAALEHVAAYERAPKLALTRALAGKIRSRGFVRYAWPPYNEGDEQLDPELFTDYPPQHPPARIDWAEGTAVMGEGHPHPACSVYGIEVNRADLFALWPGPLKPAKARRQSIKDLVKQFENSGHPVVSVTTRDGTTLHFSAAEATTNESDNPWDEVNAANSKRPS
jgi:hypothetical protein